ncbi:BON domain-containing protein [Accumulibacter sp.]|uniref:BON domain-containing protein n=1 Tax=Accumulibacter sp. TaxID=2053492 RepID=UPI0025E9E33F|nr:BON domain-containing protein [Accumulibacter sp.]MCP5228553.1 BON domain-containing protein [Accumulibacter sp.]
MTTIINFRVLGISLLLVAGLAGCDTKQPGPAESAGKQIDQTAASAGKQVDAAVDKIGAKVGDQSEKAGIAIDDTEITAKVKAGIFAEPGLDTLQISVDTVQGVVTLSGSADSPANSDKAKALAAAVPGVKEVQNELVIKLAK